MRNHIFMIGPASVGKSTVGKVLAARLDWPYLDLDLEFNARIENITTHINTRGYQSYAETNSGLFEELVAEAQRPTVFATPAGFLAHESVPGLAAKHAELLKRHGITILLLPHKSAEAGVDLIVQRQLERWGPPQEDERERYFRRIKLYAQYGDIKIYSNQAPDQIAEQIIHQLRTYYPKQFGLAASRSSSSPGRETASA